MRAEKGERALLSLVLCKDQEADMHLKRKVSVSETNLWVHLLLDI